MESGFEDDFAPMQSSAGKTATIDDDSLILGDEDSPKKTSEGKMKSGVTVRSGGVLIQSCPAGAKISSIMYFVMYNSVVLSKNIARKSLCHFDTLFAYVDYSQNNQFYIVLL